MASVTRRGDSFLAQVRLKRDGVLVFSESRTFPSEALARSWASRLEKEARDRGPGRTAARAVTVGELVLKHLTYQQSFRDLGRSAIHTHETIAQAFHKVRVHELTARHLVEYARRRRADGISPATIKSDLSPVHAAFHAARHAHGIEASTEEVDLAFKKMRETGLIASPKQAARVMSAAEEEALRGEFARHDKHHQSAINMTLCLDLALALPRRASELCRLRWADVDSSRKVIVIRDVKHPRAKIGNDQTVPLLPPAWAALERAPRLGELILPYQAGSVGAAFERARDRIAETGMPGIRGLRFHDLRATGITRLLRAGMPIPEVALVSGHTNWQQVRRYARLFAEDVHAAYDRLGIVG